MSSNRHRDSDRNQRRILGDPLGRLSRWRADSEPRHAWITLWLSVVPVGILLGSEIISFGFYYVEYIESFQVSPSTVGFIMTVKTFVISIFGLFTSSFLRRFPARAVSMCGGLILSLAHITSSFSPSVYVMYVTEGVMTGVARSLTTMTTSVLIQQHFTRNRTLANGCHMLGLSLGYFMTPPLVTKLIEAYGWRGASLIFGGIMANIVAFSISYRTPTASSSEHTQPTEKKPGDQCSVLKTQVKVTDTNEEKEPVDISGGDRKPSGKIGEVKKKRSFFKDLLDFRIIKKPNFLLICFAATLGKYTSITFLQHIPNKAISVGLSKDDAALLMSIFGISLISFRALVSVLANLRRVNRILFYGSGFFVGAVSSYLTLIHTLWALAVTSVMMGAFLAMTNTVLAVVIIQVVGLTDLPKAFAILDLFLAISAMSATPIGGYVYDTTNNYDIPYVISGTSSLVAGMLTVVSVLCKRRSLRQQQQ